ncbi:MAG: YdcF family protein [Pseudomonadota bacterium]
MGLTATLATAFKLLVLPPAGIIVLAALGLLVWRRRPRAGKALCAMALALLYGLSTGVGSWLLVHPLESLEPALAAGPSPAGAIVMLTAGRVRGSPEYGPQAAPDFTSLKRISYAAHLYRSRALPLLVTGGLATGDSDEEPLAMTMKGVFEHQFQIPVRWTENASRTTAENARFSAAMLKQAGIGHIILVTDAVHMRRARLAFERQGIAVTPGPTFYQEPRDFDPLRLWPSAEGLRRSHAALYEWFGLGWYALTDN